MFSIISWLAGLSYGLALGFMTGRVRASFFLIFSLVFRLSLLFSFSHLFFRLFRLAEYTSALYFVVAPGKIAAVSNCQVTTFASFFEATFYLWLLNSTSTAAFVAELASCFFETIWKILAVLEDIFEQPFNNLISIFYHYIQEKAITKNRRKFTHKRYLHQLRSHSAFIAVFQADVYKVHKRIRRLDDSTSLDYCDDTVRTPTSVNEPVQHTCSLLQICSYGNFFCTVKINLIIR